MNYTSIYKTKYHKAPSQLWQ